MARYKFMYLLTNLLTYSVGFKVVAPDRPNNVLNNFFTLRTKNHGMINL